MCIQLPRRVARREEEATDIILWSLSRLFHRVIWGENIKETKSLYLCVCESVGRVSQAFPVYFFILYINISKFVFKSIFF